MLIEFLLVGFSDLTFFTILLGFLNNWVIETPILKCHPPLNKSLQTTPFFAAILPNQSSIADKWPLHGWQGYHFEPGCSLAPRAKEKSKSQNVLHPLGDSDDETAVCSSLP